jgi:hypothetical protein
MRREIEGTATNALDETRSAIHGGSHALQVENEAAPDFEPRRVVTVTIHAEAKCAGTGRPTPCLAHEVESAADLYGRFVDDVDNWAFDAEHLDLCPLDDSVSTAQAIEWARALDHRLTTIQRVVLGIKRDLRKHAQETAR